jgi:hypothetical protein
MRSIPAVATLARCDKFEAYPMNQIISIAVAFIVLGSASFAAAELDVTELKQAADSFFHALDTIAKELPAVSTATGTARVIQAWTKANEDLAAVFGRFGAQHPEVYSTPNPPAEFANVWQRLSRLKTDYATVPAGVGALMKQFGDDPAVKASVTRFQESLVRVQSAGRPSKKP